MIGIAGISCCIVNVSAQYRNIGIPVALAGICFIAGKAAINSNTCFQIKGRKAVVIGLARAFIRIVGSGSYPHLAGTGYNECLLQGFKGGNPGAAAVAVIAVGLYIIN